MIELEYIEGIVLKKIDYKESSNIVYIYTNMGLRSVLVHGIKKAKSPYLNLCRVLNHVGLHVTGKDLLTLRDGDVLRDFRDLKKDLEQFTYALHISELLYFFANHEHDHEKLLQFVLKIFQLCEQKTEQYIPYMNMIELKLLYLLGVNPMFQHCVSCDRTDVLSFSIREGGMQCPDHFKREEIEVSQAAINLMMELYYHDLQNPQPFHYDNESLKELRLVLDKYYEYHLNFRSHSRNMLKGLIGY